MLHVEQHNQYSEDIFHEQKYEYLQQTEAYKSLTNIMGKGRSTRQPLFLNECIIFKGLQLSYQQACAHSCPEFLTWIYLLIVGEGVSLGNTGKRFMHFIGVKQFKEIILFLVLVRCLVH